MPTSKDSVLSRVSRVAPPVLYHYTSLQALQSILDQGKIWASDARYSNDSSECSYISQTFDRRINELLAESEGARKEVFESLRVYLREAVKREFFIACFSARRDDLSQWRAYCPPVTGVCIGIYSAAIRKALDLSGLTPEEKSEHLAKQAVPLLVPVMYVADVSGHSFDSVIELACSSLGNLDQIMPPALLVGASIGSLAPYFKNAAFSAEDEWRVVVAGGASGLVADIKFRQGKSTLIPFTEVDLQSAAPNYIAEIIVGPTPNLELSVMSVDRLLKAKGLTDVSVLPSVVPYRHW